jgi:hypothetical protein
MKRLTFLSAAAVLLAGACAEDAPTLMEDGSIVDACGTHLPAQGLEVATLGPPFGADYEGPAIVERGTSTELTLAFPASAAVSSGAIPPYRTNVFGLGAAGRLAPGAVVWLAKKPRGGASTGQLPIVAPAPESLAVYEKDGGRLLFSMVRELAVDLTANADAGVPATSQRASCTARYADSCAQGRISYGSVAIEGDSRVVVADGETRVVKLGGFDYEVRVNARSIDVQRQLGCLDYYGGGASTWITLRAKDLDTLGAGLPVGDPVACARGNAEPRPSTFSLYDTDIDTAFAGAVEYLGRRDAGSGGLQCLQFDVPGLPSKSSSMPPKIEICTPPGLVQVPSVGQQMWVTLELASFATLRTSQSGDLLLASVWSNGDFAVAAERIGEMLGVPVQARKRCAYATSQAPAPVVSLNELSFATTPPVVLPGDSVAAVPVSGKTYDVWISWDSAAITAVPR